jgi:putative Ca2+/H+ antiporter (TMEM165/GDT1 family)
VQGAGEYGRGLPTATASATCTANAAAAPANTCSGRYRVLSTRLARAVLSGRSATKTKAKTVAMTARVAGTSFLAILAAEFGDLTQIVTANLAAKYHDPLTVGLGAVLGLWAVAALAIAGARSLLKVAPVTVITRVAAAIMAVLAAISIISAIRG